MARFFGRYEHSLDAKGRLILPSKYRHAFEHSGFLTQFNDRCLALWTPEDFEKQMTIMEANQQQSTEQRHLARLWASGTQEIEVDKQGRMAIPSFLRDYAHLANDVLIIGAIDRIELWSPQEWSTKVEPSLAQLTDEN